MPATPPIPFAGLQLDRAADRRTDEAWLAAAAADPAALAVLAGPGGAGPAPVPLAGREPVAFLGVAGDGAPLFLAAAGEGDELAELRGLAATADAQTAGLAAYAAALSHFHDATRFCGRCGAPADALDGGHARRCANGHQHHPRTDPVVIMLVTDGDRALLGRQPSWPAGRYSALAGFVEPGEDLEAAVAREVLEEAGVTIGEVRYRASQPWPFPCSLMLGFEARYASGEAHAADAELEDVRWFTRAELDAAAREDRTDFLAVPAAGEPGAAGGGVVLPPRLAIARHLVDAWLLG